MTKDEALNLALEALNEVTGWQWAGPMRVMDEVEDAITAIKEALAHPEQEPVAWMTHSNDLTPLFHKTRAGALNWQTQPKPLYTTPPQRTWVGLTDDEIETLEMLYAPPVHPDFVNDADHCLELIRHVEAKLKEKNT